MPSPGEEDRGTAMEEQKQRRRYVYKTTIKKLFNLTDNQLNVAVQRGILKDVRQVPNPHNKYEYSYLFNVKEVEEHLDEIRKIEKYSEKEIERRKMYYERSRKISRISFFCPLCNKTIRPQRNSYTKNAYLEDEVDKEEARIVVIVTHFRHSHTDYDVIRKNDNLLQQYIEDKEKFNRVLNAYFSAKEEGDYDAKEYYLSMIRSLKSEAIDRLKDEKTKEAIELAKKYSLLPENFDKEEYDKIAARIKELYGLD